MGVARIVPASGIFPLASTQAASGEAVSALYAWAGGHVNCVSARDNQERVESELTRLCVSSILERRLVTSATVSLCRNWQQSQI